MEAVAFRSGGLRVKTAAFGIQKPRRTFAKQVLSQSRRVTNAVAVTSEVSANERVKIAQEAGEANSFRVAEVDSAEPQDFNPATVTAVIDVAKDWRQITLDVEISREFIPLDKAYTKPGQSLAVKLPTGVTTKANVCSPPFPSQANWAVLYKLRGDIPAGATKAPQYALSVRGPVELLVKKGSPLYNLQQGDAVEAGPFDSNGLDLRPILFISRFPTVLLFASGPGAAALRSLVEASDVGSLSLDLRADVRIYYAAPTQEELAFQDRFESWGSSSIRVVPIVAPGSFVTAFDEDDLEYDPETTAAVVLGDKKSNAEALKVLEEAGVPKSSVLVWEA